MRSLVAVAAIAVTLSPTTSHAQSSADRIQVVGARHIVWSPGGKVVKTKGTLRIDRQQRRIEFIASKVAVVSIPFDAIRALHVGKDHGEYLTVFHENGGALRSDAIQLPRESTAATIATLGAYTGRLVDQAEHSFLSIPVRASPGENVTVTTSRGQVLNGTLTALSAAAITLETAEGTVRTYDPESIQKIRRVRAMGTEVARSARLGALFGATVLGGLGLVAAGVSGGEGTGKGKEVAVMAGMGALGGAALGTALGALPSREFRRYQDIYVAPPPGAATKVSLMPQLGARRQALLLSVRF